LFKLTLMTRKKQQATPRELLSVTDAASAKVVSVTTLYRWFKDYPDDWTEIWERGRRMVYRDELDQFDAPRRGPK
jgi:hypothetical protein